MHIAEPQDAPEGIFVVDPHDELYAWLAYLLCHGSFDPTYFPTEDGMPLEEAVPSDAPAIEDVATTIADLEPCLSRMDCRHRTVLYNVLTGWRVSEVAPRIGLSVSRTYHVLKEAVAILRQNYGDGHL